MFLFDFPAIPIDTFQHGSFPKVRHLSHTYDNPTWHFALHVHSELIELIYVAGGQADIVIDGQTIHAGEGDIMLVDRGIPHSITSHPDNPSDLWSLSAANVEFCEQPPGKMVAAHTQAKENADFIEQTMEQIQAFSSRLDIPVQAACNHLCAALIVLFRQMLLQASATYKVRNPTLATDLLTYLDQHYAQQIDLDHLAQVFFLSASHISREFRNKFKISPINYLIDKRLSEAKWLLINTDEPLQVVASKVGYDNVYYFTKLFTTRVGDSPSAYRDRFSRR